MRTADLIGAKLDYWVAQANGIDAADLRIDLGNGRNLADCVFFKSGVPFRPSTNWAHGGPLIEKYGIIFHFVSGASARTLKQIQWMDGDTALIAICRAAVREVFGDEVDD